MKPRPSADSRSLSTHEEASPTFGPGGVDHVWDPGLEPERTSLAWHRLSLTLLGIALAVPKLAKSTLGLWALAPASLVSAVAIALLITSHRRYRDMHRHLMRDSQEPFQDGRLHLLTALTSRAVCCLWLRRGLRR